jgi:uncharacterized protein (DUF2147 family)
MKIIKSLAVLMLLILLFLSSSVLAQSNMPDAIIGTYKNTDNSLEVQIYKKGTAYFGIVVSGNQKVPTNTMLLKNFIYADNNWKGKVFAPARNADFDCILTVPKLKTLKLNVKAGLMSKTQLWTKV